MAVSHNYIFQNPVKFYVSSSCEKINKQKFISLSHGLHTPSCQSLAITPTNFKYLIKRALYKNYGFASHLSPCLTLSSLGNHACRLCQILLSRQRVDSFLYFLGQGGLHLHGICYNP